jgi:hypothetical protein
VVFGIGKAAETRVFDVDATRQAARQRALPRDPTPCLPLDADSTAVCAPGFTGQKRGEAVRTRTVALQMHTRQWMTPLGNFVWSSGYHQCF